MYKATLKKGDLVSLQSSSAGLAGDPRFLHCFEIGKTRIEEMGLATEVSEHALKGIEYIAQNLDKRVEDFNNAFKNNDIKMIIANIGGFDSYKVIPILIKN